MNNDLISREALKKELNSRVFQGDYTTTLLLSSFNDLIDNAPTVDTYTIEDIKEVQENSLILGAKLAQRPQKEDYGQWIKHKDFNDSIKYGCNQCGNLTNIPSNFCPNCGKRMKFGKRINLTGARNVK